jgi:hypothetical protein
MTTRHLPALGGHPIRFGRTLRSDSWWAGPLATVALFSGFSAYVTWALFQGEHYYSAPYLSPLYSPVLFSKPDLPGSAPLEHTWFGRWPNFWPDLWFLPASPALLILIFPLLFRFTCYYYRKAYYRSFAGSPPGCAVSPGARPHYQGETGFLIFQNLHRYALYFALCYVVILGYDAALAFYRDGRFGVGVGSIVLTLNAVLISAYTFGCHSLRHLVGGRTDCMSCGQSSLKYGAWRGASWFNARHMPFAWLSLVWVGFTDLYVRLVSTGVFHDFNTW